MCDSTLSLETDELIEELKDFLWQQWKFSCEEAIALENKEMVEERIEDLVNQILENEKLAYELESKNSGFMERYFEKIEDNKNDYIWLREYYGVEE